MILSEATQIWIVEKVKDVNRLLAVGWRIVGIVYKPQSKTQIGFWSDKTTALGSKPEYILGKPEAIESRKKVDTWYPEYLDDYITRLAKTRLKAHDDSKGETE